ncbi:hypothetical protein BU24DRAFT_426470 [Aaosphaeria arxii CBS 175.79]|uniref:Zn(2)-C6 fungal-type domain-containing protein n=1 Tax=Aaosphaeria arxii CBS 175.79 TaxID=1450172 RepID=A0A6A5XGA2_9PLEO|nr:uncharacterized protein BU24DRAFT_426470 [Aaosphaeria arxii CBS 175.79]KAF2011394.1 hypothetical protein BU24DRAFT_426470 [Aaosphaeria arxii CBS 175.79]
MVDASPLSTSTPGVSPHGRSTSRDSAHPSPAQSETSPDHGGTPQTAESIRKLITRKSHRKSRLGCLNCKRRRIKCDEKKPQCSNCITRDINCDYLQGLGKETPAQSKSTENLDVPNLELMYFWTTATCHSLSNWESGATFFQVNMTELMLQSNHSLHLIFCVTALHLAYCRPARKYEYIELADRHYGLGLPPLTEALANLNADNCDSVYFSVQAVCFVAFARGPQPGQYLAFGENGRSEWLIMFRGIRSTIESISQENFQKTHAINISSTRKPLQPHHVNKPPEWERRLQDLREHVEFLSQNSQHLDSILRAVDVLINCYDNRYNGKDGEYHVVFAWLYRMDEAYLKLLQQHDSAALMIYAYFAVLMSDLEKFWYMKGWTHHVMSGIYNAMVEGQKTWVRWPMAQVGWIPP